MFYSGCKNKQFQASYQMLKRFFAKKALPLHTIHKKTGEKAIKERA